MVPTSSLLIPKEGERPLFLFTHIDDEVACHGLMQRYLKVNSQNTHIIHVSNSDTTTGVSGVGELEKALGKLKGYGLRRENHYFMDVSEKECFRALFAGDAGHFMRIYEVLYRRFNDADRVYTNAFQGGNIMHDLTNYLAFLAVKRHQSEGKGLSLYEFPAYQLRIGLPYFRFGRFGEGHEAPKGGVAFILKDQEVEKKSEYPLIFSDAEEFFRRVRKTTEKDIRNWDVEHYREVPMGRRYTRKPGLITLYELHGHLAKLKGKEMPKVATFKEFKEIVLLIEKEVN